MKRCSYTGRISNRWTNATNGPMPRCYQHQAGRSLETPHHGRFDPIMAQFPKYLTQAQTAEILGVTVHTVRGWIAKGQLPAYRMGARGHIRIAESDVENLLQRVIPAVLGNTPASSQ